MRNIRYIVQFLLTLAILLIPINSIAKAVLLLIIWAITFHPISKKEMLLFVFINLIFTLGNIMAIKRGAFYFMEQDIGPLTAWEPFMWGFYCLHVIRFHGSSKLKTNRWVLGIMAAVFVLSFSISKDHNMILLTTTAAFVLLLFFFHEKQDIKYALHMIIIGTILEYCAVYFGLWAYPADYVGGVAYWYIALFGGTGILVDRVAPHFLSSK